MINKINTMIEKLNGVVSEKSEKVMTNKKVEGMVNGIGAIVTFLGTIAFGIVFVMCTASLMKTGKHYVVKPTADTEIAGVEGTDSGHSEDGDEDEDEDDE